MSIYKHKLVNGELIELTPEEIAELEERDRNPPPWMGIPSVDPENPARPEDGTSRSKRH